MREQEIADKQERIEAANALAIAREQQRLADFLRLFFAHGAAEDFLSLTPDELLCIADDALKSFSKRDGHQPEIRLFNPDYGGAGSEHQAITIVDIVNDDKPFLVDSVMHELTQSGFDVRLLVHPIFSVHRDEAGQLLDFAPAGTERSNRESFIHIHLARLPQEMMAEIAERMEKVLSDVTAAVEDWPAMRHLVTGLIADYRENPPPLPAEEIGEAIAFLTWLAEDNFTFLGTRDYDLGMERGTSGQFTIRADTGLGLMRDPDVRILRRGTEFVQITPEVRDFLLRPEALVVMKANVKSRVHRRAYMDYIGVKRYDRQGRLAGETRLVGLFTSTAYTRSVRAIPYLRHKAAYVMDRAGFVPESHSGKALLNVLEHYPRDDLFQIDRETLYGFALKILELDERPRIRVLARHDKFDRFVSVLVFVPRDRFSTEIRVRIGDYLKSVFQGRVSAFYPFFPEGSLTRIHFIIGRDEGKAPRPSSAELEAEVTKIVRNWQDDFQEAAQQSLPLVQARALQEQWGEAFPPAYRDSYEATRALADVAILKELTEHHPLALHFSPLSSGGQEELSLSLYHKGGAIPLSERVPILEAMGFRVIDERTFFIAKHSSAFALHDMHLATANGVSFAPALKSGVLGGLFMAVWEGAAESDRLNALALHAALEWREIAVLRALSRYLQQARIPHEQGYIAEALNRHPTVATLLVSLFHQRFDPDRPNRSPAKEEEICHALDTALEKVTSLDDDTILRRLMNLILAAVRTNFYQASPKNDLLSLIAFKFDSKRITALPKPHPFAEIWVYSPRVEGVHLRFGPIARGGLRWSDRPQDFRTEVLGLVKAQQVKNAVIVPVGAKGGFFPKRLPQGGGRDAITEEGIAAYKLFVDSLLGLTDNLDAGQVIPPPRTIRYDGDDPYLVVAADKGTATFSDIANKLSEARGFWLADAFASGGSAGYDHKKMGITARGAFEAVKRHFREMDINIETTPFTVAGVGDMSGDVFGNGMLLSPVIRLLAAFDHRHIFIDPDPDPTVSFAERKRLFALPRSSWADYDAAKISKGGGIFPRTLKAIPLSAEMQTLLGLVQPTATPQEVMRAILTANVDLLWFGGIGTYVRAADESDAEAGDRANDALRVTAEDVRAKVIGEGANLGMTQKARIAYALKGGRVNSDAVDNSAGVNSSDVEVNIKIALNRAVKEGRLDLDDRNRLLAAMTPDVAKLVLANNYRQTLCVSVTENLGLADFGFQRRLMTWLEERERLDRKVETLPDDVTLLKREQMGQPLTRPEIGVLMAYAKIVLFDDLVTSAAPDEPLLEKNLFSYFPPAMQEAFAAEIRTHPLRREIIATQLANRMINAGGPAFIVRLADQTGATPADIARAYLLTALAFELDALETEIDALDNKVSGALQLSLYCRAREHLVEGALWMLRNQRMTGDLAALLEKFRTGIAACRGLWEGEEILPGPLIDEDIPPALAAQLAFLARAHEALDAIMVAESASVAPQTAASVMKAVSATLQLDGLETMMRGITARDYYEGLALERAQRIISEARRTLAVVAARREGGFAAWVERNTESLTRLKLSLQSLLAGEASLARVMLACGLVSDLAASQS